MGQKLHKTDRAQRPRAAQLRMATNSRAVERAFSRASVTYQLERVKCGKKKCRRCKGGPAHGPYWYAYWKAKGRTRTKYVGKDLPRELALPELRQLGADDITRGCAGRPGAVFEEGGPLPCTNVAQVKLVDRGGRLMCGSCAGAFKRLCKREGLKPPQFTPIA